MGRNFACAALGLAIVALLPLPARAEVVLSPLFADGAVLQRDMPLRIWGAADPGETFEVSIAGRSTVATADGSGRWRVELGALEAGGPHALRAGDARAEGVLVGEVWICSGQSNMEWPLAWSADPEREVAAADHERIRLFKVPRVMADETALDFGVGTDIEEQPVEPRWRPCAPSNAKMFSAVGYHFGRELRAQLDVPIGLIQCAWGGTAAEAWTSPSRFASDPLLAESRARTDLVEANRPSVLFCGMLAPLVPLSVRGVIWYQGEANARHARQYRVLFPAMIESWREAWGRDDLPFLFTQLAAFLPRDPRPVESDWAELREAQAMTLALAHTGMAVTIDIGDAGDIHPKNKREVGHRLALVARSDVYGEAGVVSRGPSYGSMSVEGGEVRVRLFYSGGLAARGDRVSGFAVAGEDRSWHWAEARIEADDVVVGSPRVPRPVAVRYGWANNPDCNLVNAAGLPAVPFRTDDWPRAE